ncbi:hypothetical protein C3G49_06550, partial [Campylobacter coli]|nr:hypothetical protein [Campylobacter coli]
MSYHPIRINEGSDSKNKYLNSKIFCDNSKTRKILLSTVTASLLFAAPSEISAAGIGTAGKDGTTVIKKGQDGANGSASQKDITQDFSIINANQTIQIDISEQNNANGKDGTNGTQGNNGTNGQTTGYSGDRTINGFRGGNGSAGTSGGNGGSGNNLGNITINAYEVGAKTDLKDKEFVLTLKGASGGNGGDGGDGKNGGNGGSGSHADAGRFDNKPTDA